MTRVLITGGGGFLGQKLARKLGEVATLRGQDITEMTLVDLGQPAEVPAPFPVNRVAVDVSDETAVNNVFSTPYDVIFHLAAVVSGAAEADFDLGMRVNLFGTMRILDAARRQGNTPVVVYASSVAVHGGEVPDPVPEGAELNPQTSYGSQKAMGELLVQDMSRKGLIDGRGLRLPTVTIRPGKANAAASSFMSSIFRDTMQGNPANCPVSEDYVVWHTAPRTMISNLLHAAEVDAEAFGFNRNINLPGRSDSIGDMIAAMDRVAGPAASRLITRDRDPAVEKIALGWRGTIRHDKALRMGFTADASFEDSVRWFLEDDIEGRG